MKPFAKAFYTGMAWKNAREAYTKQAGGLCEICWSKGLAVPGEIVHHKIPLTPENISDPNIALGFDNLQLVCRQCHAEIHEKQYVRKRRYTIDEFGRVSAK